MLLPWEILNQVRVEIRRGKHPLSLGWINVRMEVDYFPCHLENKNLSGGKDQSCLSEIRAEKSCAGVYLAWLQPLPAVPLPAPAKSLKALS